LVSIRAAEEHFYREVTREEAKRNAKKNTESSATQVFLPDEIKSEALVCEQQE
jgi:hypothetical protein